MRKMILPLVVLMILMMAVVPASSENQISVQPSIVNNLAAQQVVQSVQVPAGFQITIWADNVPGARSLEWTPNGTLFVGSRDPGNVYALRDDDSNGVADGVMTIGSGYWGPNGVAFRNGSLYVADLDQLWRYDNIEANLTNPPAPVPITALLAEGHHGWKFIRFGPDGRLYVPVGAPCNVCAADDERFSSIMRMNPDGSNQEVYAHGIRNTVGFDWHPATGEMYFTDNGADEMGDDIPDDELNRAPQPGMHFGFPYCHAGDVPDPNFTARACDEFTPPVLKLGAHVAALGMRFYTGGQFPADYRNQILMAQHGSWNRSTPVGYRVMLVRLDGAGNPVSYEPFAEGWLQGDGVSGRPVDIEQISDGSILVSDDFAGAIYRIHYVGAADGTSE